MVFNTLDTAWKHAQKLRKFITRGGCIVAMTLKKVSNLGKSYLSREDAL